MYKTLLNKVIFQVEVKQAVVITGQSSEKRMDSYPHFYVKMIDE